jgi:hypothetical protein
MQGDVHAKVQNCEENQGKEAGHEDVKKGIAVVPMINNHP